MAVAQNHCHPGSVIIAPPAIHRVLAHLIRSMRALPLALPGTPLMLGLSPLSIATHRTVLPK